MANVSGTATSRTSGLPHYQIPEWLCPVSFHPVLTSRSDPCERDLSRFDRSSDYIVELRMAAMTWCNDTQLLAHVRLTKVLRCRRDVMVNSKFVSLRNGKNLTQTKPNYNGSDQKQILPDLKQTNYVSISDLLKLSRPLQYEILVSGGTVNSPCMTISREQHLLVSSIFVSCVSLAFVASSAILPCSDLFQRLHYQGLTIAMRCHGWTSVYDTSSVAASSQCSSSSHCWFLSS